MIELPPDRTFYIMAVLFLVFWQFMRWAVFVPAQTADPMHTS